jgi:hypothetical protein
VADYTIPSTPIEGTGDGTDASATTYDLPNFVGELFSLIPAQTPFLSMAGGLTGGRGVSSTEFGWQVEDNIAAAVNFAQLEGQTVAASHIPRQEVKNVVEIHQESVSISYSKQGATGMVSRADPIMAENFEQLGTNPVGAEVSHQLALKINKVARDVELSFLSGVYANPAANTGTGVPGDTTMRQTRGIITAATTHTEANGTPGTASTFRDAINTLLVGMFEDETEVAPLIQPVIFVNGSSKVLLSEAYTNNGGLADRSRTIGGVNVETLVTDFGSFGVVLDRYMPVNTLLLADMSVVKPCFMAIPGKGHFFTEPLAKTGAYDRAQLYGEIGLEYGPEQFNGTVTAINA